MELKQIQKQPTCLEKIHESCYRSYHILDKVMEMINRNDSKETIIEMVEFLRQYPIDTEFTKPEQGN